MQNRNIYPYLIKAKASKKTGEIPIYISIEIDSVQVAAKSIQRKVLLEHWDAERKCIKDTVTNAKLINAAIKKRIDELEAEFLKRELLGSEVTKQAVRAQVRGKANLDYATFCREVIPKLYKVEGTIKQFLTEVNKLEAYCGSLSFSDINYEFLTNYKAYMRDELENEPNTIFKAFKTMRRMCYIALKMERIPFHPILKCGFYIGKYEDTDPEYLEWDEVLAFRNALFTKPSLTYSQRRAGWHFILQCCSGLRFSDVSRFKFDDFVRVDSTGHRLVLETKKNGEMVSIAFTSMITEAVNMVCQMPYDFSIANQVYNSELKVVGGVAGITKSIASHMGRHSFGMRCAELGMKEEDVMRLMGHRNIKHTRIYFKIKNRRLDEAMQAWEVKHPTVFHPCNS
jgi:integrase